MRAGARSNRGRARRANEDSYCFHDFRPQLDCVLAAVADGMGGHLGGEVASRMAVEVVAAVVERELAAAAPPAAALARALETANEQILAASRADPAREGMGTTLTAVLCQGTDAHLGHVGDSRAYLVRGRSISQLTEDHTLVGAMVKNGDLTEEEAMSHPQRNLLTQALGTDPVPAADFGCHPLEPGDVLVLCTDGLHGLVDRGEILDGVAGGRDPREAVDALVRLALRRGGHDDVTVIVCEPLDAGGQAP